MYQIMAEIVIMKFLKAIIGWYCYVGTGIVAIDQVGGLDIPEALNMSPAAQAIVLYLLIIFWVIKIAWFIYDKFHLERQERNLEMDKKREEIIDLKGGHK